MRAVLLALMFVAVAFAHGGADEEKNYDDSDVLKLTKDNFEKTLHDSQFLVVKFFAPWCGHCKHLAPEYAKAATILKNEEPPVLLAEVDATVETDLASRYGVSGYPTLKVFRYGADSNYEGPRDVEGIVRYLRNQNGPSAKLIDTVAKFDEITSKKNTVFTVAFFGEGAGKDAFIRAADSLREDYSLFIVTNLDILNAKHDGKNGMVTYKNLDGEVPQVEFTGDLSNSIEIKDFIKTSSVPVASVYTANDAKRYYLPRLVLFSKVDQVKDPSGVKYLLNRLRKAAAGFEDKLHFTLQDKSSPEFSALGFGDVTSGMAVITKENRKYKSTASFTIEAAKQFAQDYLDGKVEMHIKSQPIPEDNSKPVKTIVGKTFAKEVTESDQDVFIKFYAPWCGHCKHLAPVYEKLAEKMSQYPTLKIVEYDATENDVPPEYTVRGFPTLYLLKADDKSHPVQYQGDREAPAMESWLRENVAHKLPPPSEEEQAEADKEKMEKKEKKKKEKEEKKRKEKEEKEKKKALEKEEV